MPGPFTLLLAFVPILGYLATLGMIRVFGKTLVTTGSRDIAALGLAIAGLAAVGPAELFFPVAAATVFGPVVWIALAVFYALCVALIALTSRPKLVVYGRTPEELYEPLLAAARRIDSDATGDLSALRITLPDSGIHLRLDGHRGIDHAQVLAFEPGTTSHFWRTLLANVREEISGLPRPAPRRGFGMLLAAVVLGALLLWQGIDQRALVVEDFRQWLWRQ